MKLIRSLLETFVDIPKDLSGKDLGLLITRHIAEVDSVHDESETLKNIIIARIETIAPHPNADRLRVTQVNTGKEMIQIVCGGTNIREGAYIILALPGSNVRWHGEGELIEIKDSEIRGQKSFGMICAADEIGLGNIYKHEKGEIVILPEDAPLGMDMAEYLGKNEVVFEIDNKSLTHRPDLWGHYGFARELAVVLKQDFKDTTSSKSTNDKRPSTNDKQFTLSNILPQLCPTFLAQAFHIEGAKTSPEWLQKILQLSDIGSIHPIVDLTNYIMIELGQPMHAYDQRFVKGGLIVRNAQGGEKLMTLDKTEKALMDEDIVIADSDKVLGVAGVIGGQFSEIRSDTQDILVEAATFDGVTIRKTAQRMGIRTEASKRFEKYLDPELPMLALKRFEELLLKIYPEMTFQSDVLSASEPSKKAPLIIFDPQKIDQVYGRAIPEAKDILEKLGFGVEVKQDVWEVTVPSHRATKDITLAEDLVEEIVRIEGYDHIPPQPLTESVTVPLLSRQKNLVRKLSDVCSGLGYTEVMSYSLIGDRLLEKFGLEGKNLVKLQNSVSKEHTYLRPNLLISLCDWLDRSMNLDASLGIFEVGTSFVLADGCPKNIFSATAIKVFPQHREDPEVLYEVKATAEALLNALHISFTVAPSDSRLQTSDFNPSHPMRAVEYVCGDLSLVRVYELHPDIMEQWKWKKKRVGIVECNLENIQKLLKPLRYSETSKYPSIIKGFSYLFDREVLVGTIQTALQKVSSTVVSVRILDVFEGDKVGAGMKAVALEIEFQSSEKTLEEQDIVEDMKKVEKVLEGFGGKERKM